MRMRTLRLLLSIPAVLCTASPITAQQRKEAGVDFKPEAKPASKPDTKSE